MKRSEDIESLLRWTYLDELPKRQLSSAEGLWNRMSQYGSLGGVNPDPGHGSAQRYAHFGLPHPDAELIEKAVGALGRVTVDWDAEFDIIVGDLAALVTINDVRTSNSSISGPVTAGTGRMQGWRSTREGDSGQPNRGRKPGRLARAPDGRGVRASPTEAPRDVILVNTINVAALVTMHAVRATRPDWRSERMEVVPTPAERGPLAKVIGTCKGKNRYTTGSYCPLRFEPSPITIIQSRADYRVWHRALVQLSQNLGHLTEHIALPPQSNAAPWIDGEKKHALFTQGIAPKQPLLLKPSRKLAGPPLKKPRANKGRSVALDRGRSLDILTTPTKG